MKISYVTTCHNRLWQLKQTLDHNLAFIKQGESELCILAYNDGSIEPYLLENYSNYLKDGRIKVRTHHDSYTPTDGSDFACGYVKNLSHAMGVGEILFNLDVDNFIDSILVDALHNLKPHEITKSNGTGGVSGRIGVHRRLFNRVGGYRDVGRRDDGDFVMRCLNQGARLKNISWEYSPIANSV